MSDPKKYIIHDNVLYEEKEGPLVTTYTPFNLQQKKPIPAWRGAKIPWIMWQEMIAWCQVTQEKFSSEALVMLFYDREQGQWSHWYPPQNTQGMSVKADDTCPEYKEQRKAYPDLQFGTLHHHCTAGAFASGTDKADEEDREGLHFTIGGIGSKEHSVHYRICIQGSCYEGNAIDVIEPPANIAGVPQKYLSSIMKDLIKEPADASQWDFSESLKNVKKITYSHPPYNFPSQVNRIGYGMKNLEHGKDTSSKGCSVPPATQKQWERLIEHEWEAIDEVLETMEYSLFDNEFADTCNPRRAVAKEVLKFLCKTYKSVAKKEAQEAMQSELICVVYDKHCFIEPKTEEEGKKFCNQYLHQIHLLYESQYT